MDRLVTHTLLAAAALTISGVPVAASAHAPAAVPHAEQTRSSTSRPTIEVAFVLDTTGSMSGLIEGAKRKIWSIASRIARGKPTPRLRVGLVGYRDKGDAYVTRRFDLTDNLDAVFGNLQKFTADGGGDTPEHVGRALGEAVKHFSWSPNRRTLKMIFLVGDAPPQLYQDGWNYKSWAKQAIAKDVIVNTVRCGGMAATETAFREIANLADGQFVSIDGSGGMVAVSTPYDAEIAKLSSDIAATSLYAGDEGARRTAKVAADALSAMEAESVADRAGYAVATGSGGAALTAAPRVGGAIDIVAASAEALDSVSDDELPPALRRLSKAERQRYVAGLKTKRALLAKRLVKLTRQRNEHLEKNASSDSQAFDDQVMEAVKARAASKGVSYD